MRIPTESGRLAGIRHKRLQLQPSVRAGYRVFQTILGHSLESWIREWQVISQLAPDNTLLLPGRPTFLGYILQKFRVYGGALSEGFSQYAALLEKSANADIATVLRKIDKSLASTSLSYNKLGQVKDFGQLAAQAQTQGVAFDSVSGGATYQRDEAKKEFAAIARRIIDRTSAEASSDI